MIPRQGWWKSRLPKIININFRKLFGWEVFQDRIDAISWSNFYGIVPDTWTFDILSRNSHKWTIRKGTFIIYVNFCMWLSKWSIFNLLNSQYFWKWINANPMKIFWTARQSSQVVDWVKTKSRLVGNQIPFGGTRFCFVKVSIIEGILLLGSCPKIFMGLALVHFQKYLLLKAFARSIID